MLITLIGEDMAGEAICSQCQSLNLSQEGVVRSTNLSTPSVVYCLDQGIFSIDHDQELHLFYVHTKSCLHIIQVFKSS